MKCPRIIISALRGGSGKTILSLGIIAALRKRGFNIAPFKKGPDYIDAGWLAMAAGRPCYNLDNFLISPEKLVHSLISHTKTGDIAIIEANRGLYDSIDIGGSTSTAELAKFLKIPVILILDCTKTTRTMAAVVMGCKVFDPDVNIAGVILNRVARPRHECILRLCIEKHTGISVLGALPKLRKNIFPERHMGLVPNQEHDWAQKSIEAACNIAETNLDLDLILTKAFSSPDLIETHEKSVSLPHTSLKSPENRPCKALKNRPRIGIAKDSAFQFYYEENLEALVSAGAELVYISPVIDKFLPDLDALYIGGGFPETHIKELSENTSFCENIRSLAENGLPIYAECGGLIYMGEKFFLDDKYYDMAGILPIVFGLSKRPQGHGYTIISVDGQNPYFSVGSEFKGHEFHYSKVLEWKGKDNDMTFKMIRGSGFKNHRDGICYKNVLATYTHLHALGTSSWAPALVKQALKFQKKSI
ncbi:Cobyrinate a,c-diamide synthase [Candidatus Magnetomoraceae bacterium gMMP-15]